jgi:hypothetical protein
MRKVAQRRLDGLLRKAVRATEGARGEAKGVFHSSPLLPGGAIMNRAAPEI